MYGKSEEAGDYQRIRRPVGAMAVDFVRPYSSGVHFHRRSQLLFSASGVLTVRAEAGTWIVPPLRGVWVPAMTKHSLRTSGRCAVRTLFIAPSAVPHLPRDRCAVIPITPLVRELIVAATQMPMLYREAGRDGLVVRLLLAELRVTPLKGLHLPMPGDGRALQVAEAILARPGGGGSMGEHARRVFVSEKTLARLFFRETGMTFGRWRQQARLLASMPRLAAGEPVLNVALGMGYESPSAFSAMFRRALGCAPTAYFEEASAGVRDR